MKYYKSCDTLLLWNFFKVIETKDFKYLMITDDYDNIELKEDLTEIWEAIIHEYSEISNNKNVLDRFENYKKVTQLIATYKIITAMIYTLYFRYNQIYIDDLALFGYKIDIKHNIIQVNSLRRCEQMARSILNEIDSISIEFNSEEGEQSNVYYTKVLPNLISNYGDLNEKQLTVAKYIGLMKGIKKINGRNKRN